MINVRKSAFRLYTSTMTDCDQSTGLNAKSKPPVTPPTQQMSDSVLRPSVSVARLLLRSMSAPDRLISNASTAHAAAPHTAEQNATPHAGLGWPL